MNSIRDKNGRIMKGNVPWNKGVSYRCSEATEFKKGNIPVNDLPIYTERILCEGKYGIPRAEIKLMRGAGKKNWQSKAKYVWLQNGNTYHKGYIMYHKDGDSLNDTIQNLECISRAELMLRNSRK